MAARKTMFEDVQSTVGELALFYEDEQLIGGKIKNANASNELYFAVILFGNLRYYYFNLFSIKY